MNKAEAKDALIDALGDLSDLNLAVGRAWEAVRRSRRPVGASAAPPLESLEAEIDALARENAKLRERLIAENVRRVKARRKIEAALEYCQDRYDTVDRLGGEVGPNNWMVVGQALEEALRVLLLCETQ